MTVLEPGTGSLVLKSEAVYCFIYFTSLLRVLVVSLAFPSCPQPLFQSEAKCEAIVTDMK